MKLGAHSIQDASGLVHFTARLPESRQARGGSKLQHCCMLILRDLQGLTQTLFCCLDRLVGLPEQQLPFQPEQFRLPKELSPCCRKFLRVLNGAQAFVNAIVP